MTPPRVQLSRRSGFRLRQAAPGAVVVSRPSRFGNPFTVAEAVADGFASTVEQAREVCADMYRDWLDGTHVSADPGLAARRDWILGHLHELAGLPLACWCPAPAPGRADHCHAAHLIRLSNSTPARPREVPAMAEMHNPPRAAVGLKGMREGLGRPEPRRTAAPRPKFLSDHTIDGVHWHTRAACRDQDPELFFPIGNTGPALLQIQEAKEVCYRCPVIDQCLQWALDTRQDAGVWGGTSEDDRRSLKRRAARAASRSNGATDGDA